jgi:hypothetical protein
LTRKLRDLCDLAVKFAIREGSAVVAAGSGVTATWRGLELESKRVAAAWFQDHLERLDASIMSDMQSYKLQTPEELVAQIEAVDSKAQAWLHSWKTVCALPQLFIAV